MLGQTLGGKYRVVRLLGEGGMGAVYECEQQLGTTKRKVAIKTLHPHLSLDANIKARFEREVGTVAELEHPNTIQVYDFGTHADGILYIAMEYLQGKSLANLLEREGALAPDRIERIVQQVCGSLEEAHERGGDYPSVARDDDQPAGMSLGHQIESLLGAVEEVEPALSTG